MAPRNSAIATVALFQETGLERSYDEKENYSCSSATILPPFLSLVCLCPFSSLWSFATISTFVRQRSDLPNCKSVSVCVVCH